MLRDSTRLAALLVACLLLGACSRGARPYGARLTYQEFITTFPLRDLKAYPLQILASPDNPRQLLTVRIDLEQGLLLVHADLERLHELARIPFSARHGPWSVTLESPAFARSIRMEVPDSETLVAEHKIGFKN